MPDVDNEYKSQRVTVVPDLVLKRVIEYDELSLDPLPRLVRHSDSWSGRNDEAEMRTDPAVSRSRVRPDVHDRMHHRKLYLQTITIVD